MIYQTKKWRTSWTGNQVPVLGMCQFSWFCDGKSDEPKDSKTWIKSVQIANNFMMNDPIDITEVLCGIMQIISIPIGQNI